MPGPFFFAWVDASETTFAPAHEVEDEEIVGFNISQDEGDFASLTIDVRNPRIGLLNAGRDVWAWFSRETGSTAGVVPLFFGRLIGVPQSVQAEVVTLEFIARPADFDTQKEVLAESLRAQPFYDPIWLSERQVADADSVLEALNALWHIDRITHVVSVSDNNVGEDGTADLAGNFIRQSLEISYGDPPARKVEVTGKVEWSQKASGVFDVTDRMYVAFGGSVASFSERIESAWPTAGSRSAPGWTVETSQISKRGDLTESFQSFFHKGYVTLRGWFYNIQLSFRYEADRKRQEEVSFTLSAGVQSLLTEAGDDEVIQLDLSSQDVDKLIDPSTTSDPDGVAPIGDVARNSYFATGRGHRSVEYLISLAAAKLLFHARAVRINVTVPWAVGIDLSCRQNVRVADARIPGGSATGKVIGYELIFDGGAAFCRVAIGCTVGDGSGATGITADDGDPDYVEDGYVEDWQTRTDRTIVAITGTVAYDDYAIPPGGADIPFGTLVSEDVITAIGVVDGLETQQALLRSRLSNTEEDVVAALAERPTTVTITFVPMTGGPFGRSIPVTVTDLVVPRTIDLEAAA